MGWQGVPLRQFTNRLRRIGFEPDGDSRAGGERCVFFKKRVSPARVVNLQLWEEGKHRVSHSLHGSMNTYPTAFETVEEMLAALAHETERKDNRDYVSYALEHFEGGCAWSEQMFAHLASRKRLTSDETPEAALARRFGAAIAAKLVVSEEKYGWNRGWMHRDWYDDLRLEIRRHVDKGDPVDVGVYAAFAWHHGWTLNTEIRRAAETVS